MSEPWREMLTDQQRKIIKALDYDSATGIFRWKTNGRGPTKRAGAIAGSRHSRGYVRIKVDGVTYYAHRIAWLIEHGRWPVEEVDHINRDRADNRICNLREATVAENRRNNCGQPSRRRSRFKGVVRENKSARWVAKICTSGSTKRIGLFDSEEDAAQAYRQAALQDHGEFASW